MDFATGNDRIIETLQPYLVATPWSRPHFDLAPFGLPIADANVFNPLRLDYERFAELLERMDGLTFGPEGMPMPRWVFYNGSELPGGIMGFGLPAQALTSRQREVMGVGEEETGLVPLSMFIAIPMLPRSHWMGHNLASMNAVFPEAGLKRLASITKAFGLRVYGTEVCYGATQWQSIALYIHTKFGPLDLVTAYTPAHSNPMTFTYRVEITEQALRNACGDPSAGLDRPAATFSLAVDDVDGAHRLQDEIERGARYVIVDRPVREGGHSRVPLCEAG